MNTSLFVSLTQPLLLLVFVAFLILFIYFGSTFVYHWNFYSFNVQLKRVMSGLYFFGSVVILLVMLFFIGLYLANYGI